MASQSTSQSTRTEQPPQQPEQDEVLTLAEHLERYPHGIPLGSPYPAIVGLDLLRVRKRQR